MSNPSSVKEFDSHLSKKNSMSEEDTGFELLTKAFTSMATAAYSLKQSNDRAVGAAYELKSALEEQSKMIDSLVSGVEQLRNA